MLDEFDDVLPTGENQGNKPISITETQLEEFIATQKACVDSRRVIQSILVTVTCQVTSASLALLLFQFAVDFSFTWGLCSVIASLPVLPDLAQIRIYKSEDSWRIESMGKPVLTLIRFGLGVFVVSSTIYSVADEIKQTEANIQQVYSEIKQYEYAKPKDYIPPYLGYVVLAASAITAVCMVVRSFKNRSPFE